MGLSFDKPLVEYDCSGTATLETGKTLDAKFLVGQLLDGNIAGSVDLVYLAEGSSVIMMASKELGKFSLEGVEKKNGFKLIVSNCHFTRITPGRTTLEGQFVAGTVLVRPDVLENKIEKPVLVIVSVTNMYKTFRVIVEGPLGKMQIAHDPKIDAMETSMSHQRISMVTSDIEIFVDKPYGKSVRELFEDVKETVTGFLNATRLAQTCWHDWCSIAIYQKDTNGAASLVALKIRLPWRKEPTKQLETEHSFESALHWYLESSATEVLESKYLLACTCLELLVDRFEKQRGGEFIISGDKFKELSRVVRQTLHSWFSKSGISEEKQKLIHQSVQSLNRPSLRSKIEALLDKWNVKYNDLDLNLQKIIDTRNQITHTGISRSEGLIEQYMKLYVVLTRVFLSMLRYDDDYWDWVHGTWRHQDWL